MNFRDELEQRVVQTEDVIEKYLPAEEGEQKTVLAAMNYSIRAGGKRLRPMFMNEIYKTFGGTGSVVEPFMAAQEMIHTYSLVHDDLPAMDNDELRRGRKTTHVVYGEAMAILAGDALLNYAFETALKAFELEPDNAGIPEALKVLASKAGIYGMLGGQVIDVEAEELQTQLSKDQIMRIHEWKTGALIQSSMMIGAILAGASKKDVEKVANAALYIGVAFQIQDDILDVEGDENILGKPIGSDAKNEKTTYVSLRGIEKSKEDVKMLSEDAMKILERLPQKNEFLLALVQSLINREK